MTGEQEVRRFLKWLKEQHDFLCFVQSEEVCGSVFGHPDDVTLYPAEYHEWVGQTGNEAADKAGRLGWEDLYDQRPRSTNVEKTKRYVVMCIARCNEVLGAETKPVDASAAETPLCGPSEPLTASEPQSAGSLRNDGHSPPSEDDTSSQKAVMKAKRDEYKRLLPIKKGIDQKNIYKGQSVAILKVFQKTEQVNQSPEEPVLLLGEPGVGKSYIARLIHESSDREKGKLVEMQATDFEGADSNIWTSSLVGHGKGAGITRDPHEQLGMLDDCAGGALFIDEMGDLHERAQTFLLRLYEQRPIPRRGGRSKPVKPDVRLIFATNKDVDELVKNGEMRRDFLSRFGAQRITIPPLDDRKEDIFDLVPSFAKDYRVTFGFYLALIRHSWSEGNVRELRQVVNKTLNKRKSSRRKSSRRKSGNDSLTADLLDIPCAEQVAQLSDDEIFAELYTLLRPLVEKRGYTWRTGLHRMMSEILGISKYKMTRWFKRALRKHPQLAD